MKLKKVGLLSLALLTSLSLTNKVKAEGETCTYKNYYYFHQINHQPDITNALENSATGTYTQTTYTAYPQLPWSADIKQNGKICFANDQNTDGKCIETINEDDYEDFLRVFYTKVKEIYSSGKDGGEIIYKVNNQDKNSKYMYIEEREEDTSGKKIITRYYKHGAWSRDDENEVIRDFTTGVDYSDVDEDDLVNASFIPHQTNITFQPYLSPTVIIERTFKSADIPNTLVPVNVGEGWSDAVFEPALYYIEYEDDCEDIETYNATINYYYYKDGKTTDRVEFDNNEPNPYIESELEDGYTKKVTSPDKKGCSIVNESGKTYEADKEVTILIDKDDFTKNVYYHCPAEDEGAPVPTGDFLIYIAWAVGLGAIGYSVYYFKKMKKEEV